MVKVIIGKDERKEIKESTGATEKEIDKARDRMEEQLDENLPDFFSLLQVLNKLNVCTQWNSTC